MADKLNIYNQALALLGERHLTSLGESREARRVLDDLWLSGVAYCLEQGLWHFGSRTVLLEADASVGASFGFSYAFKKPDDYIRTVGLGTDPDFRSGPFRFVDEGGYWWSDTRALYVRYLSSDPGYGNNIGEWPETFAKYLATHLAAEASEMIAKSQTKTIALRLLEKQRRSDARIKDSQNEAVGFLPGGTWAASRFGGSPWSRNREHS